MATAVAEHRPSNFEIELAQYEPQFAAALPSHITPEKFRRVVVTAINSNPDLVKADRRSLFTSCIKAAQDGLFPDGRDAALVIFGDKVQYMPMIHGIRKRMRNTGEVKSADAYVVFSKDHFDYELGDNPHIEHKPALIDRGDAIGAYAIIKLTNGEILREFMSKAEIEKVRAVSRAKSNGPWVSWWEEMARKTVLRRCSKAAPDSADLDRLLARDEEDDRPAMPLAIEERPERGVVVDREDTAEPFEFQDTEGVITNNLTVAKEATEAFMALIDGCRDTKTLNDMWESNTLSGQLRDRGYADLADAVIAACEAKSKDLAAKEAEARKKDAAVRETEETERKAAEERAAEDAKRRQDAAAEGEQPANDAPAAATQKPTEIAPAPKSPVTGKGDWPTFMRWFTAVLRIIRPDEIQPFLAQWKREYDFIAEHRSGDRDQVNAILDDRRMG